MAPEGGPQATNNISLPFNIQLTDSSVVSRTGDLCLVAMTDQWYINYSDPEWKAETLLALDGMRIEDPELRTALTISVKNMRDWCVSREYGLGTRLPGDTRFLIDSLSDSTIYMAYYTVAHVLQRDPWGREGYVPVESLTTDFWSYVFGMITKPPEGLQSLAENARQCFLKHYPVDLRVSGKDLIYNHLAMSLYQHVALFNSEHWPKEYRVNGYVNVNGTKMSKSLNNFVTCHQLAQRYSNLVALKLVVLEAGDGLNDANIRLKDYDSTESALRKASTGPYMSADILSAPDNLYERAFYYQLLQQLTYLINNYKVGRWREGLQEGWRRTSNLKTRYAKHMGQGTFSAASLDLLTLIHRYALSVIDSSCQFNDDDRRRLAHYSRECHVIDDGSQATHMIQAADYWELIINVTKGAKSTVTVPERVIDSPAMPYIRSFNDLLARGIDFKADPTPLQGSRDPFKVKPYVA